MDIAKTWPILASQRALRNATGLQYYSIWGDIVHLNSTILYGGGLQGLKGERANEQEGRKCFLYAWSCHHELRDEKNSALSVNWALQQLMAWRQENRINMETHSLAWMTLPVVLVVSSTRIKPALNFIRCPAGKTNSWAEVQSNTGEGPIYNFSFQVAIVSETYQVQRGKKKC